MDKFGRTYCLTIATNDGGQIQIANPFTLEFYIQQGLNSLNTAVFKIKNLSSVTRTRLFKDWFPPSQDKDFRPITLNAGYGTSQPEVFVGTVRDCTSYKLSGSVDVITEINCFGSAFAVNNAFTSRTIGSIQNPPTRGQVISALVDDLGGTVAVGKIGSFPGTYPRGRTIVGPTWTALQTETGNKCYIYNGKVYALQDTETIDDEIFAIDDNSGLLGTPKRSQSYVIVEILFEPRFKVGQLCQLNSQVIQVFNNRYKVMSFVHSGIISDAVGGNCKTTVNFLSASLFVANQQSPS